MIAPFHKKNTFCVNFYHASMCSFTYLILTKFCQSSKIRLSSKTRFDMQIKYLCFPFQNTVNPQKRPVGLILSLRVQMQVLLEFCRILLFFLLFFNFSADLIRMQVLIKGWSLQRIYGIQNLLYSTLRCVCISYNTEANGYIFFAKGVQLFSFQSTHLQPFDKFRHR